MAHLIDIFKTEFPNAPEGIAEKIFSAKDTGNWWNMYRKAIAYLRHNFTDYDSRYGWQFSEKTGWRHIPFDEDGIQGLRSQANREADELLATWKQVEVR